VSTVGRFEARAQHVGARRAPNPCLIAASFRSATLRDLQVRDAKRCSRISQDDNSGAAQGLAIIRHGDSIVARLDEPHTRPAHRHRGACHRRVRSAYARDTRRASNAVDHPRSCSLGGGGNRLLFVAPLLGATTRLVHSDLDAQLLDPPITIGERDAESDAQHASAAGFVTLSTPRLGGMLSTSGAMLAGIGLALVFEAAFSSAVAQDWIPFRVAATLAPSSRWSEIYPEATASNLFSVPLVFQAIAKANITREGPLALPDNELTAFVSPPPAAFLLAPLVTLSWTAALVVSRFALALPLVAAMFAFAVLASTDSRMRLRWSWLCAIGSPLLMYTIAIGQPSAWLFTAAVASVVSTRWLDVIGGVALGLAIVTKGTPLALAVGLLLLGRRRLGGFALAVAGAAIGLTAFQSGPEGWGRFVSIAGHVSRSVLTDWNNVSVEAEVLRWTSGHASPSFSSLGVVIGRTVVALKLLAVGGLIWSAWQSRGGLRGISALWIAWLIASPIVWLHYLVALLPLVGTVPSQRSSLAVLCVASLSLPIWLRPMGASALVIGHVATLAWLATACLVMWRVDPEDTGDRAASQTVTLA
jgi:Glycosyltransferase family 87